MAYTVKLGTFAKNIDSTAQPTTTGWAEYSVTLKNGADISNPQLEISVSWSTVKDYNYAVMMDRYYWITGKNMLRENLCVIDLKVDVLATYKSTIGSQTLYVLRAASSYDGTIKDEFYPPTGDIVYSTQAASNPGYDYSSGCYVLNVMGTDSNGATTLYQLTPSNFKTLINELYTEINGWQLADSIKKLGQKFGGNPTQLINGCHWYPTDFTFVTSSDYPVKIGGWTAPTAVGKKITSPIGYLPGFNPTIAAHPQVAKGRYLNLAPYSKYELYVPCIGLINLDTSELMGINKIYVTRHIDAFTGRLYCIVQTDPDSLSDPYHYLAVAETQWGVPITLSGGSSGNAGSFIGQALGVAGGVAAAIATGGAAAIIGAAAGGIGTIVGACSGAPSNCSTGGAFVGMEEPIRLDTTFYKITSWDDTHNGRPLMQNKQISTLSGYIIVQKGDVPISGPLPEAEEVKRLLESGFYYE